MVARGLLVLRDCRGQTIVAWVLLLAGGLVGPWPLPAKYPEFVEQMS